MIGQMLLAVALLVGSASPALAWGALGHRTIAAIALANVRPGTAAQIARLLRAEPQIDTPQCPLHSLADASVWPDCVRKDKDRWAYTVPWHYQNMEVCAPFAIHSHCADGNCVTAQIVRDRRLLANRHLSDGQRLEALAFLTHFVGDVHQPLHGSDHEDEGGNQVAVEYRGETDKLHYLWDTPIAEAAVAGAPTLVRLYTPRERATLAGGSVADWARESWEMARHLVYRQALGHDPCVGDPPAQIQFTPAQIAADAAPARRRLVQAGLRLARLLDEALAG